MAFQALELGTKRHLSTTFESHLGSLDEHDENQDRGNRQNERGQRTSQHSGMNPV